MVHVRQIGHESSLIVHVSHVSQGGTFMVRVRCISQEDSLTVHVSQVGLSV